MKTTKFVATGEAVARKTSARDGNKKLIGSANAPRPSATVEKVVKDYFVDEAGDLTIFGKGGKVVLGQEGVSRCFMLGSVLLSNPSLAHSRLEALRQELMQNPLYSYAPSMHPDEKKTARYFHATDDLPEVRSEVIKLLPSLGARVVIAVRRKEALVGRFEEQYEKGVGKTQMQNAVYDELVTEVFHNTLRTGSENRVTFARRAIRASVVGR